MRKEELFDLIGELDTDLLYDAHAKPQPKLTTIRRTIAISAAAAIAIISVVIYALFVAPVSFICLDADEYVTVTLNHRENILSVAAKNPRFESVTGSSAGTAIDQIVLSMMDSGTLSEEENTLLIASDRRYKQIAQSVIDLWQKHHFDGSVIGIEADAALLGADSQSQAVSPAKAALMNMIASNSETLSYDSLKELSVNELNLLLQQTDIDRQNIFVSGKPSQRMFIGADKAEEIAFRQSRLSQTDDVSVSYSVYQHKLIYLVELRSSDSAEAYFISADTGEMRVSLRANTDTLSQAVHREISASNSTALQDDPGTNSDSQQNKSVEATESAETVTSDITEDPTQREDISESASTSERTEDTRAAENTQISTAQSTETTPTQPDDGSSGYRSIPISMLELSFVTMTPPPSANEISYQTIFEGQYFENRTGEKQNKGVLCIITSPAQLRAFLSENDYAYLDREKETFRNAFSEYYFTTHSLIVSSCTFSDASYYTSVTDIRSYEGSLYIEDSLAYGESREGEYYCRTLSVYEVSKEDISADCEIIVY